MSTRNRLISSLSSILFVILAAGGASAGKGGPAIVPQQPADQWGAVPLYFLLNLKDKNDFGHYLITADQNEFNTITRDRGWWLYDDNEIAFVFHHPATGLVPLFRLRSTTTADHFFTTSQAEGANAERQYNYVSEGLCCYIYSSRVAGSTPLFRLRQGQQHVYSVDPSRREYYLKTGWIDEGIAGFVATAAVPSPP